MAPIRLDAADLPDLASLATDHEFRREAERLASRELGPTVIAAQRAMALNRLKQEAGASDPYRPLDSPPDGDGRFRRHRHPR